MKQFDNANYTHIKIVLLLIHVFKKIITSILVHLL